MLTSDQITAVDCLEAGMAKKDVADVTKISLRTIYRWLKDPEFIGELHRRRDGLPRPPSPPSKSILDLETEATKRMQSAAAAELREYREKRILGYVKLVNRGTAMLDAIGRRLLDLPDEAITPALIAPWANAAANLMKEGYSGWSEILAIGELLGEMENGDRQSTEADATADSGATDSSIPQC